jgi:hypothetical protein
MNNLPANQTDFLLYTSTSGDVKAAIECQSASKANSLTRPFVEIVRERRWRN